MQKYVVVFFLEGDINVKAVPLGVGVWTGKGLPFHVNNFILFAFLPGAHDLFSIKALVNFFNYVN